MTFGDIMKIDIYSSAKNRRKYLSVPAGSDVTTMKFPADFDPDLRELRPFKSEHEVIPGRPYIALDAQDVVNQIEAKGFAQHSATITIKIR
jgi:hypothetical protein